MKFNQYHYSEDIWTNGKSPKSNENANFVLIISASSVIDNKFASYAYYQNLFPNAPIVITTSAGEIFQNRVFSNSILALVFEFENTIVKAVSSTIDENKTTEIAIDLAKKLYSDDLKYLLVLNDGLRPKSSQIIEAINSVIPKEVIISGGLSGDDQVFAETRTGLNQNAESNQLVIVGFYGEKLEVCTTVSSGWEAFGKKRLATKSDGNILYEIDNISAYDVYKNYLGDAIDSLPGSGLVYPFQVKYPGQEDVIIRTVMYANPVNKSIIIAGEIPIGSELYLMNTNKDGLVEGAENSSQLASNRIENPDFIMIISCIGRKMILGEWVEDEVDAVKSFFESTPIVGFYSYGEYAPTNEKNQCFLHNETMCLTLFKEHA